MPMQDNIVPFDSVANHRKPSYDTEKRRVIGACRDTVVRTLPQLMNALFDKLDDALYEFADKADNNALQSLYFEAMREMRKVRGGIGSGYRKRILRQFDEFWMKGPQPLETAVPDKDLSEDDFSLIDDDEMEETLAITNMVTKSESRYQRELHALNERFSCLLGGREVTCEANPLGPASLCRGFQEAMHGVDVDIPVRLVVYKLFDRQVMDYIGGMYDELNAQLAKMGVLPKLAFKRRYNPVAPSVRSSGEPAVDPVSEPGEGDAPQAGQAEVFAALQHLLDTRRGHRARAQDAAVLETGDLLAVLSTLQQTHGVQMRSGRAESGVEADLRTLLSEEVSAATAGSGGQAFGQADDDTIDVISMLFEFILEDGHLPDAMKALISRLQIPILKVAILDKTFFSKKLHPARRLLNSLAQAAMGWTDDGDRSENGLYGQVEHIVRRVLNEFDDDPGLFEELNSAFSAYLDQERRGAEVAEERTNQVTRGREQLNAAKQVVAEEIARRLEARSAVPKVVLSILNEGWKDVLLLIYLRQGPDSDAWMRAVELMEKLLWSVEPKRAHDERQALLRTIPELLKGLREGLDSISFDHHKTARLFKELQACHIACLRGGEVETTKLVETGHSFIDGVLFPEYVSRGTADGRPSLSEVQERHINQRLRRIVDGLAIGTWIDFKNGPQGNMRAKLSWRSDKSDIFVFVNRKGVKVVEMHSAELADAFLHGRAEIIRDADVPIMDRALAAMMKSLKGHGVAGSSPA